MGRLSMQNCPKELANWGCQRKSVPSIESVDDFHQRWVEWWGTCQPKWRLTTTWLYDRGDTKDKDWNKLNVMGPHGFFAVIMSASWWVNSMDLESFHDTFSPAVEDLHWVIEGLIHYNTQSKEIGSKPSSTPPGQFPGHHDREPGKRQVKPSYKVVAGA